MKKTLFILIPILMSISIYSQIDTKFFSHQNDSIFYEVQGQGKSVLLLSGGPGGSPSSLLPIMNYVSENNRAILLHQRGTGLSGNCRVDSITMTMRQYVTDIDNLLETEGINDSLYIIGHSWGAMLALEYMVKRPDLVKGVILIGASGYSLDFVQGMNNEIFGRMSSAEIDSIKSYINELNRTTDFSMIDQLQDKMQMLTIPKQFYNPLNAKELLRYGSLNRNVNSLIMKSLRNNKWNLRDELMKTDIPVIIINGSDDPIPKSEVNKLSESLRNSELHYLDHCGHYVRLEKPRELQYLIETFLSN